MATMIGVGPARDAGLAPKPITTIAEDVRACEHCRELTSADVVEVAEHLGIDFAAAPFTPEDLLLGMAVELELGHVFAASTVHSIDEDLGEVGKIAVANLQERSDYYRWMTQAHAPGDQPISHPQATDVGSD